MKLVLIRHADAAPGEPDELRALTPEGHEQARRLGEQLRSDGVRPDAVLSSPLLRARQTAGDLGFGEPESVELLAPGASEAEVRDAIAGRGETVVVVAHQPDCSRVAAALSGGPEPDFPPASVQIIEL